MAPNSHRPILFADEEPMHVSREPGMNDIGVSPSGFRSSPASIVEISPPDIAHRRLVNWGAIQADNVRVVRRETFEYGFQAQRHLLVAYERAERDKGETLIEGLPKSTLREFNCKLSFVPAGHRFHSWQTPRVLTRLTYFYIDLKNRLFDRESGVTGSTIGPRLFFFDQAVWDTALKLKAEVDNSDPSSRLYVDALSLVLMHELGRLQGKRPRGDFAGRFGEARRSESLSLCARLQALLWRASASLPYGPADGSRQGPAAVAGALGDADRHSPWLSRNQFVHAGIS
jgi:hypothetical protein